MWEKICNLNALALFSFWDLPAEGPHSAPQGRLCGAGAGAEVLGWRGGGSFCLLKYLIILLIKSKFFNSLIMEKGDILISIYLIPAITSQLVLN